jgi:hypothetical protein
MRQGEKKMHKLIYFFFRKTLDKIILGITFINNNKEVML